MALSITVALKPMSPSADVQAPACRTKWTTCVSAGGLVIADNGGTTIFRPGTQIVDPTRKAICLPDSATAIMLRMACAVNAAISATPVVQVFGCDNDPYGEDETQYTALFNNATTPNLQPNVSEYSQGNVQNEAGTFKFTTPTPDMTFKVLGHAFILVGVTTIAAGLDVIMDNAYLQLKAI